MIDCDLSWETSTDTLTAVSAYIPVDTLPLQLKFVDTLGTVFNTSTSAEILTALIAPLDINMIFGHPQCRIEWKHAHTHALKSKIECFPPQGYNEKRNCTGPIKCTITHTPTLSCTEGYLCLSKALSPSANTKRHTKLLTVILLLSELDCHPVQSTSLSVRNINCCKFGFNCRPPTCLFRSHS